MLITKIVQDFTTWHVLHDSLILKLLNMDKAQCVGKPRSVLLKVNQVLRTSKTQGFFFTEPFIF